MNFSSPASPNLHYFLASMTVINAAIAILAVFLNFLIILTFVKTASLRTPSNILVLGLAISDFGAGVIAEPIICSLMVAYLTGNIQLYDKLYQVQDAVFGTLLPVSFYTLTAITIDRFLAIHLHLRYQLLITGRRYKILLVFVWISRIAWSICIIFIKGRIPTIIDIVLFIGLIVLNGSFIGFVYKVINRHSAQIEAQHQSIATLNLPRYKKSVKTMYFVIGAFVFCYIPHSSAILVALIRPTWDTRTMFTITETLVMMNSVLNPIIYCWRIPDIKTAARQILLS